MRLAISVLLSVVLAAVGIPHAHAATAAAVVATIPVGSAPWGIAFTPDGTRAFVGNSGSTFVSVIDVAARTESSRVSTGSVANPAGIGVTPDGTKVLVTGFGSPYTISAIDSSTLTVTTQTIGCVNPLPITVRNDGASAYTGCGNGQLRGTDVATLTTTNIRTDTGSIDAVAYVPQGGAANDDIAYILNAAGSGEFKLSNANGGSGSRSVLPASGRSIAVDSTGTTAYVGDAAGNLSVFTITSPATAQHTILVGGDLRGIALSPDGDHAYVTDSTSNLVKVVDLSLRRVISSIAVGSSPQSIAISPDGRTALVTNNTSSSVSVIDIPVPPASGDDVPRAALQQFARHPEDTCESQPTDLIDFPALASLVGRNWGTSWAQWPNGGTGGSVCTRQPYYTSTGTWAVG